MKSVIKEIAITLLIFVIVVLALFIVVYDYIPTADTEITISKYEPSDDVKEALEEIASSETTNVILTYEVTDSDLDIYETTKSYDKGKANPFASFGEGGASTETVTDNNNNSNNGTTNNNNENKTNTFYEQDNTK